MAFFLCFLPIKDNKGRSFFVNFDITPRDIKVARSIKWVVDTKGTLPIVTL
jgi:hypothetical protein